MKITNISWFDIRNIGFKPEKKQFLKKFTSRSSIDCCDQSSSDNLYIKLLISKTYKTFLLTIKKLIHLSIMNKKLNYCTIDVTCNFSPLIFVQKVVILFLRNWNNFFEFLFNNIVKPITVKPVQTTTSIRQPLI